jgi:hypothetical protein
MIVLLWAAVAMVCQDILGVMLTQAEARNRAWTAAWLDALYWIAGITTTYNALGSLHTHSFWHRGLVIGVMTCANVFGTVTGTRLGKRWIKTEDEA